MKRFHIKGTALELADLCEAKNRAYGDSVGKSAQALQLLYAEGLRPDQYLDALIFAREFDKHSRLAQGADAFGEDPRLDIAGYALLHLHLQKEKDATCPGDASSIPAPVAKPAPETPVSAAQNASESTTQRTGESNAGPSSPSPEDCSASTSAPASTSTASAPAPTAPEAASANAAGRVSDAVVPELICLLLSFYVGFCSALALHKALSWFYLPPFALLLVASAAVRVLVKISVTHQEAD